jgi:hypothetical protein
MCSRGERTARRRRLRRWVWFASCILRRRDDDDWCANCDRPAVDAERLPSQARGESPGRFRSGRSAGGWCARRWLWRIGWRDTAVVSLGWGTGRCAAWWRRSAEAAGRVQSVWRFAAGRRLSWWRRRQLPGVHRVPVMPVRSRSERSDDYFGHDSRRSRISSRDGSQRSEVRRCEQDVPGIASDCRELHHNDCCRLRGSDE